MRPTLHPFRSAASIVSRYVTERRCHRGQCHAAGLTCPRPPCRRSAAQVGDAASVIAAVAQAANPPSAAPAEPSGIAGAVSSTSCRVFAVGVGAEVSHHLVRGVARAGNGTARFLREGQDMRAAVLGQLKQAMQVALDGVSVTWNSPARPAAGASGGAADGADGAAQPPEQADPPPRLVPSRPPPVFGGERFLAFALFDPPGPGARPAGLPESVTVTARRPTGEAFRATVTVAVTSAGAAAGAGVSRGSTGLHRLAAREAIRELEEEVGRGGEGSMRGEIVRLGVAYGLASSATAFVAVDVGTGTGRAVVVALAGKDGFTQATRWRQYEYSANSNLVCAVGSRRCSQLMSEGCEGSDSGPDSEPETDRAGRAATRMRVAGPEPAVGGSESDSDGAARLCLLQRADGRFSASANAAELEAAAGVASGGAALRAAAAAVADCRALFGPAKADGADTDCDGDVWATAVAVAALRARHAGARGVWGLAEGKALAALRRMCPWASGEEIEAALAALASLLCDAGPAVAAGGPPVVCAAGPLAGRLP
jgi:hypothetical protein